MAPQLWGLLAAATLAVITRVVNRRNQSADTSAKDGAAAASIATAYKALLDDMRKQVEDLRHEQSVQRDELRELRAKIAGLSEQLDVWRERVRIAVEHIRALSRLLAGAQIDHPPMPSALHEEASP